MGGAFVSNGGLGRSFPVSETGNKPQIIERGDLLYSEIAEYLVKSREIKSPGIKDKKEIYYLHSGGSIELNPSKDSISLENVGEVPEGLAKILNGALD